MNNFGEFVFKLKSHVTPVVKSFLLALFNGDRGDLQIWLEKMRAQSPGFKDLDDLRYLLKVLYISWQSTWASLFPLQKQIDTWIRQASQLLLSDAHTSTTLTWEDAEEQYRGLVKFLAALAELPDPYKIETQPTIKQIDQWWSSLPKVGKMVASTGIIITPVDLPLKQGSGQKLQHAVLFAGVTTQLSAEAVELVTGILPESVENCEQGLIVNLKSQEEHDKMLELSGHIVRHTLTFSKMSHGRTEVLFVPIDVCCNANFCLTTVPNYERRNDRLLIKIIPRDEIWIGPWRGSGTYGEVFEGTWNERDVAIKKFRAHESVNRETFLKEARNSCEMSHSNIVQFFGIVDNPESGELLLVMELMCGSLADLLKTRCLEHSEIVRYALDIAKGLRYLHKRDPKIIHRDLKPANILVNSHGAKLADFGQSRTLIQDALANTATGTFGFIAPEILAEVPYDERVDIFSLGAVIFTMNTNKVLPIKKLKRLQKISAEITNQELQQLVVACCQTDPARRPSVDQCIDILEKLV